MAVSRFFESFLKNPMATFKTHAPSIALVTATAVGPGTAWADNLAAIEKMVDLFAVGPISLEDASNALVEAGWDEAEDPKTIMNALTSAVYAFQLNPTNIGSSVLNAEFMAASALGNSALGPNQLGFTLGDVRLGVLGIEEGTPYCVATGPAWLLDVAAELDIPLEDNSRPGPVRMRKGNLKEGMYADALIDMLAVAVLDPTEGATGNADYPVTREMFDKFLASVDEATIHINSEAALKER